MNKFEVGESVKIISPDGYGWVTDTVSANTGVCFPSGVVPLDCDQTITGRIRNKITLLGKRARVIAVVNAPGKKSRTFPSQWYDPPEEHVYVQLEHGTVVVIRTIKYLEKESALAQLARASNEES